MRTFFYTLEGKGPIAERTFVAKLTPQSAASFERGAPLPCEGATVAAAALLLGRVCRQILGESVTLKLAQSRFYVSMRDEDGRWYACFHAEGFGHWCSHKEEATAFVDRANAEQMLAVTPRPEWESGKPHIKEIEQ